MLVDILKAISDTIKWGFEEYKEMIFGMSLGLVMGWIYHRLIGMRILINSYKQTISSKNETIIAYKQVLNEKLDKIKVEKESAGLWKRLRKFFRSSALN